MLRILFLLCAILFSGCGDQEFSEFIEDGTREVASAESEPDVSYSDLEGISSRITGWSKTAHVRSYFPMICDTMQADFTAMVGSNTFTIMFSVGSDRDDTLQVAPTALITWSVEGNSVSRLVSVRDGLSISGTGQGVHVAVWDDMQPPIVGDPINPALVQNYSVEITIAPGVRASTEQPPYFTPWITRTDGGNTIIELGRSYVSAGDVVRSTLPTNGGFISILVTHGSAGIPFVVTEDMIYMRFFSPGGFLLGALNLPYWGQWIPLPNFTGRFEIIATATLTEAIDLSVTIGVDG